MAHEPKHGKEHGHEHAHADSHAGSHAGSHAHDASMRNAGGAHEHRDINVRAIFGFLITLTVVAIVIQLGLWGMFKYLKGSYNALDREPNPMRSGERQPPQHDPIRDFPQPRLQADPVNDVNKARSAEEKILSGAPVWLDEQAGVVRIPIDQAMKLTVERGLPVKVEPAPAAATPASSASAAPQTKGTAKK